MADEVRRSERLPVLSPADWKSADLAARADWLCRLDEADIAEIDAAHRFWKASGAALKDMNAGDFPAPRFAAIAGRALEALEHGPGTFMIRGFPIERYGIDDARAIYWGLGKHLGTAMSQSDEGDVLGDVRDIRVPPDSPRFRAYKTSGAAAFHTDSCDVAALFVLRAAKSGGVSMVASSVAVHNEILRTRPDLLEALYRPFAWSMQGQERAGEEPFYPQPIFTAHEGFFSCRYIRGQIKNGQRFAAAPRLTKEQIEAMDLLDRIAANPAFHFVTNFQPGDLQLCNNHVVMHARSAFEDHPEPERQRHLLRMWLSVPNSRPLSPLLGRIYRDRRPGAVRGGFPAKIPGQVVFETSAEWENRMNATH
ncbi:MAG TPA: TauD/TfdA family dioxygenase [Stellaceae bacterium]|nr:TauD/TfdA family dioxygenase [Stellaceae bacterium]